MNFRLGLMLASALAVTAGACAPAAGTGGATTTAPRGNGTVLAQGERPRETNDTKAAERALEDAAEAESPDVAEEHYATALAAANQAIVADSTNPLGHLLAARAQAGLGNWMEAGAEFDRAEALRPIYELQTEGLREQAWMDAYNAAQPALTAAEYLAAAEILEGANAVYQGRPEIMILLGQIYAQEGDADLAVARLRAAQDVIAELSPNVDSAMAASWAEQGAEIPVTIAQAYISGQRFDEASQELRTLVEANPDNLLYQRTLASIYVQGDQPDSATAVYNRLMSRSDLKAPDLYDIGVGFYNLDMMDQAADAFQRAATVASNDRDALEMWARSLQLKHASMQGDPAPEEINELIGAAQRWVDLDPNSRAGHLILAQAVNKTGDEARTSELVAAIEALEVAVGDFQITRSPQGGATLTGTVENIEATPGNPVTIEFTFFDRAGNAIGTESVQVRTPAAEAKELFRVQFDSDREVAGYSYEVQM